MRPNIPITLLLADDTEMMRMAIQRLLEDDPEIEVVGEAADFTQTIKMTLELKPQIVVLDVHMPNYGSLTPLEIRSSFAPCAAHLLAISIWDDTDTKTLAASFGAVLLLDKAKLGTELVPTIKRLLATPLGDQHDER